LQFLAKRTDVTSLQFAAGGGIEIAVDATCLAEGNMDVDTCHASLDWLGRKYTIFFYAGLGDFFSLLVFNTKMDIEMRKDFVFSLYL